MSSRHDVCACTQPGFGPCPRQQVRHVQWNERSIAAVHTVTGASLPALREAMLHHGTRGQPPDVPVTFQLPGSKAVKAVLSNIRRCNGGGAHWSVRQYVQAVGEVSDHGDWLLSQIKGAIPNGYTPAKKVAAIMWSLQAVKRMTDKPHGLVDLLLGKSYRIDTGVMSSKRCNTGIRHAVPRPLLCFHLVGIETGVLTHDLLGIVFPLAAITREYHRCHVDPNLLFPKIHLHDGKGGHLRADIVNHDPLTAIRSSEDVRIGAVVRLADVKLVLLYPPTDVEIEQLGAAVALCHPRVHGTSAPTPAQGEAWIATFKAAASASTASSRPTKKPKVVDEWQCTGVSLSSCVAGTRTMTDADVTAVHLAYDAQVSEARANAKLAGTVEDHGSGYQPAGQLYDEPLRPKDRQAFICGIKDLGREALLRRCQEFGVPIDLMRFPGHQKPGQSELASLSPTRNPTSPCQPSQTKVAQRNASTAALRSHMSTIHLPGAENDNMTPNYLLQDAQPERPLHFVAAACAARAGAAPTIMPSQARPYAARASHCSDCGSLRKKIRRDAVSNAAQPTLLSSPSKHATSASLLARASGADRSVASAATAALSARLIEGAATVRAKARKIKRLEHNLEAVRAVLRNREQGTTDSPGTVADLDQALRYINVDGEPLVSDLGDELAPDGRTRTSLLDQAFPPGSLQRVFYDQHRSNVETQIANGNKQGVRYDARIQHGCLQLLSRVGKSGWGVLSKLLPSLPTYRLLSDAKNLVPLTEDGPLVTMLAAMRLSFESQGHKPGSPSRAGVLTTDEMYIQGSTAWSVNGKTLIGFSTVSDDERLMSAELQREYDEKLRKGSLQPRSKHADAEAKVATRYSVFMWTGLGPNPASFPVGRHGGTDMDTAVLALMIESVLLACITAGFEVRVITMDGASNNRAWATDNCTISAARWFTEEDKAEHPDVDFDIMIAMPHPISGDAFPIFVIFDPSHWLKKGRNSLDLSSRHNGGYDERDLPKKENSWDLKVPKNLQPPDEEPDICISDGPKDLDGVVSITGKEVHRCRSLLQEHFGAVSWNLADNRTFVAPDNKVSEMMAACSSALKGQGTVVDRRACQASDPVAPASFLKKYYPLNLKMIQRGCGCLPGQGPYSNEMTINKLKLKDFDLSNGSSKMVVSTASIVLSRKAQAAIRWAGDHHLLPWKSSRLPGHDDYAALLKLMAAMDDIWDICNTSNKGPDDPQTKTPIYSPDDKQLDDLLHHLAFFHKWKRALEQDTELTTVQRRASFITPETWIETQAICVGFNALARCYVRPRDQHGPGTPAREDGFLDCLILRRITSDKCENHFADVRQNAGGKAGMGLADCYRATATAGSVTLSHTAAGKIAGRNSHAGEVTSTDPQMPWTLARLAKGVKNERNLDRGLLQFETHGVDAWPVLQPPHVAP